MAHDTVELGGLASDVIVAKVGVSCPAPFTASSRLVLTAL